MKTVLFSFALLSAVFAAAMSVDARAATRQSTSHAIALFSGNTHVTWPGDPTVFGSGRGYRP